MKLMIPDRLYVHSWWQLRRRVRLWRSHRRFMRDLTEALSKPVDPSTPTR